jgi:hypothetical protein
MPESASLVSVSFTSGMVVPSARDRKLRAGGASARLARSRAVGEAARCWLRENGRSAREQLVKLRVQ